MTVDVAMMGHTLAVLDMSGVLLWACSAERDDCQSRIKKYIRINHHRVTDKSKASFPWL
jgi:hypothetical protein